MVISKNLLHKPLLSKPYCKGKPFCRHPEFISESLNSAGREAD